VRMFTELLQVIPLPRCSTDERGMRYAAPCAQPVFPWSEASPLFLIDTDAPRPRRRRSPNVALVPQPASSTLSPLTSSVNVHRTGSELRMRLPSPSSLTYTRQSSATRFQNSLVSSARRRSSLVLLEHGHTSGAAGNGMVHLGSYV
jgi:hypothetical protein